ncbi:MAG: hypothetical protein HFH72_08785 [Lachnospiraceae bacterium]|nr:hypothetical protein [Lachnospiraceae bacterium]
MSRSKNIVPEFTKDEQDYIKEHANFTERELELFELKNMEYSHELCAEKMNLSTTTIKKVFQSMLSKIARVWMFKNNSIIPELLEFLNIKRG